MSDLEPKQLVSQVGSEIGQASEKADQLFVLYATRLQEAVLQVAAGVSLTALSMLPAASEVAKKLAIKLGRESEHWAADKDSIVLASVPGAAYRTAAVMELVGEACAKSARRTVRALFGEQRPVAEKIDEHYREIGRSVAMLVDEGLDVWPLSEAIRDHVKEIRNLKRR